jgi:hypothetical protein
MSDVEPGRHLMNQSYARQLKGKVVDRIEREGDSVKIWFNDGTAIEIGYSHPSTTGGMMVYFWRT